MTRTHRLSDLYETFHLGASLPILADSGTRVAIVASVYAAVAVAVAVVVTWY